MIIAALGVIAAFNRMEISGQLQRNFEYLANYSHGWTENWLGFFPFQCCCRSYRSPWTASFEIRLDGLFLGLDDSLDMEGGVLAFAVWTCILLSPASGRCLEMASSRGIFPCRIPAKSYFRPWPWDFNGSGF